MVKIYSKDECPKYVFKYCSRQVFDEYITKGSFRLGTLTEYRTAYEEKGAEYGDSKEGNLTTYTKAYNDLFGHGPEGAAILDFQANAYIYSTTISYSVEDHKKWYQRDGCKYDVCLKIDAEPFFVELAYEVKKQINSEVRFYLAKPLYNDGFNTTNMTIVDPFLPKNGNLNWENEYRLICHYPRLPYDSKHPLIVQYTGLLDHIDKHYMSYEKSILPKLS